MEEFVQSLFAPLVHYGEQEESLLQEHLRRLALWCKEANIENRWPMTGLAHLGRIDRTKEEEGLAELERILEGKPLNPFLKNSVRNLIAWISMEKSPFPDLPDPYEPLIELYQKGGNSLSLEHNALYWLGGGGTGIHPSNISKYLEAASFPES